MKLRLLSSLLAVSLAAACATSTQTRVADPAPGDGTNPDGTPKDPAAEESDDPANQPPHSLGTIVLGEAHSSGTGKSTPIVSAIFVPDAMLTRACKTKLDENCEITKTPKCSKVSTTTTGCNSNEACSFDTDCNAVCKPFAVCEKACDTDEVCKVDGAGTGTGTGTGTANGICVKADSFDAGPLAFSGTTTSITMFPPYKFEGDGSGAPFLGGAEIHVQASGATEAGFQKFDEKYTATTFLQTTPSLSKIPKSKVFGTGALPIAWAPANDTIVITVSGVGGSAVCKVKDSLGKFDVPRSVVKAVQTVEGSTAPTSSQNLSVSVARQKKDVKKDKHAIGTLASTPVKPDGWLELVTLSTESASFQGCATGQDICDDTCTDVTYDSQNCGSCGNVCSSGSCNSGTCSGSTSGTTGTSCASCRATAESGSCSTYLSSCQANTTCDNLDYCWENCTTTSCQSSCLTTYSAGSSAFSPLRSCLSTYCSSQCAGLN